MLGPAIMKKKPVLALLLSLLTTGLVHGDKILLHDGTELEGTVLSGEGDSYRMEVQVTPSIKDIKLVKKANIKSILRPSKEGVDFKAIESLIPTPDRLSGADYDKLIDKQVKTFADTYPKSIHKREIRAILATLESERTLAKAGGLKLDGEWITPEDRESNAYEIEARMLYDDIAAAAAAKKSKKALRTFEKFEADFSASAYYEQAVATIQEVLKPYGAMIQRGVNRADGLVAKRTTELGSLSNSQRSAALADIKRREAIYDKLLKEEEKRGTKWLTLEPYHREPMAEVLRNIQNERKRLAALTFDPNELADSAYRDAWTSATSGDEDTSRQQITTLKSLRVPERYLAVLEARLAENVEATPEPDPVPAPDDAAEPDPPVDEAPAEAKPPAAPEAAPDPIPPAPEEEEGGLLKNLLLMVMVIVLITAAVAVFTGRKKK